MNRKIVIFGERPGPNTDPARPLFPHTTTGAAARLIRMLGMTEREYLEKTVRYNVAIDPQSPTTDPVARERVSALLELHRYYDENLCKKPTGTKFVVLGRAAAQAFPPQYRYQPFGYPLGDVMIIPHPSGRNRFYNSQDNKEFIEQSLRDFLGRNSVS